MNLQFANGLPFADPISSSKWKPYPDYKDSAVVWLGGIPRHWEVKKLKHVVTCLDGRRIPLNSEERAQIQGEHPYWGANGVLDHLDRWLFDEELVLLGEDGAPFFEPNKDVSFFVRGKLWVNNHAHVLRASDIRPKFLTHCLNTVDYRAFIDGSTRDKLTQGDMNEIPVQVPSDREQTIIEAFLDGETAKIDALVSKKERLIELLEEKRAALITRAVTKGLPSTGSGQATANVPMKDSGVEWLGEIPSHWEVRRIKFFTTYVTSGSRGWAEYYSDDGAIFLRIGNLTRTGIDLDLTDVQRVTPPSGAEGERTRVRANDVLISITAYIGSVAVVDDKLDAYVNQHIALTRPVLDRVSPRWIAYCFLSAIGKSQFQQLLYGGTKDGLGLDDVRNLIASLPPVKEQTAIVEFLDKESANTDSLIAKIQEGIERLKEYRTALIFAAVTGKIDVREDVVA